VRADFKNNKSIPNSEEEKIKALLFQVHDVWYLQFFFIIKRPVTKFFITQGEKMLRELKQNVDLALA
jgi:hypothetical protein